MLLQAIALCGSPQPAQQLGISHLSLDSTLFLTFLLFCIDIHTHTNTVFRKYFNNPLRGSGLLMITGQSKLYRLFCIAHKPVYMRSSWQQLIQHTGYANHKCQILSKSAFWYFSHDLHTHTYIYIMLCLSIHFSTSISYIFKADSPLVVFFPYI